MLCPVCTLDTLTEVNGRLYCTHDKIVVGKVPTDLATNPSTHLIPTAEGRSRSLPSVEVRRTFTLRKVAVGLLGFAVIFYGLFSNFLYVDIQQRCLIQVVPSVNLEFNSQTVIAGLRLLKEVSPTDYAHTCSRINTIQTGIDCGGFGGGCHYPSKPHEISISTQYNDLAWTAAVIVHETCHALQTAEKRELSEDECHREDDRLLRHIVLFE